MMYMYLSQIISMAFLLARFNFKLFQENYPRKYVKGIPPIEQVGTFDPLPNEHGEKLCSLNLERIAFWVGKGIKLSEDVSTLLGKQKSNKYYTQFILSATQLK